MHRAEGDGRPLHGAVVDAIAEMREQRRGSAETPNSIRAQADEEGLFNPQAPAGSAVPVALLLDRPLGRRNSLQPPVRDRPSALNRETVRSRRQPRLRPVDGGQLSTKVLETPLVELVLVEVLGTLVTRLLATGSLKRTLALDRGDPLLDPCPFAGQQLTRTLGLHEHRLTPLRAATAASRSRPVCIVADPSGGFLDAEERSSTSRRSVGHPGDQRRHRSLTAAFPTRSGRESNHPVTAGTRGSDAARNKIGRAKAPARLCASGNNHTCAADSHASPTAAARPPRAAQRWSCPRPAGNGGPDRPARQESCSQSRYQQLDETSPITGPSGCNVEISVQRRR